MGDKRIGAMIDRPNPKCCVCNHYMVFARTLGGSAIWHCNNCGANYFKVVERKKA